MSDVPAADAYQHADGPIDAVDDRILSALAVGYDTVDPMPAGMTDRIAFAVSLQALEAEVARLLATREPAGVRAEDYAPVETITFTSNRITAMVTVGDDADDSARVDGWVTGGGVRVELRVAGEVYHERTDANGRFVFPRVPHGMAQFVFRHDPADSSAGGPVLTPTIQI